MTPLGRSKTILLEYIFINENITENMKSILLATFTVNSRIIYSIVVISILFNAVSRNNPIPGRLILTLNTPTH